MVCRISCIAAYLAVTVLGTSGQVDAEISPTTKPHCVDFTSHGRLRRGESFRTDVGGGLEFRLTDEGPAGWMISVGPKRTAHDYLWPVSPPLQTAPHLFIGPAYGQQPHRSAQMTPRKFRFVLTRAEYDRVVAAIEKGRSGHQSTITAADLERMGRGTLVLRITGHALVPAGDELEWITFRGTACGPHLSPKPL